ncbi:MAG TPA: undecaprenyl-diphosphate phosphatase [Candidatus Limnocylindrales bacterium]|nr:undecaprenyl-diphosphate phosphatase [Candidatus Limnocylindrales bacterium]
MDETLLQALVMGVVQGLTEFLPISSSGHLILVPALAGWDDAFLTSLAFSVMLHVGTLGALLVYFRDDWLRLIPAGLAALRDRSFAGSADRRLAWLLAVSTIPAGLAALAFGDVVERDAFRQPGLVVTMLVVFAGVLWLADRWGSRSRGIDQLGFAGAAGIGLAQAIALIPGVSRSGATMSAALFAGLDRPAAARYAFLMATPITALAAGYELVSLATGDGAVEAAIAPLLVGVVASFVSGLLAIAVLLRYLRTRSFDAFVAYRLVVAAVVVVAWLQA